MMGGSLLSSVAGAFIGSAIAHELFGGFGDVSAAELRAEDSSDEAESSNDEARDQDDVDDEMGDLGD
jgi:hypothetical protein